MTTLAALAAELAARSDAELLRLLALRPDAASPQAPTFAALAGRLSSVHSIRAALNSLTLPQLQLLSSLAGVHGPAGPDVHADRYADALHALHERALVIAAPTPLQDMHDGGSRQFSPLALVGDALGDQPGVAPGFAFDPPRLDGAQLRTVLRENAAASATETLLRTVTGLLESIRRTPLAALRDGTVGVRPVRQLGAALDLVEAQVCFYLELAAAAGLAAFAPASRHWFATDSPWSWQERPEQWMRLVVAWLGSDQAPVPTQPASGAIRALAPAAEHAGASEPGLSGMRGNVLSVVAAAAVPSDSVPLPGSVLAPSLESVLRLLAWRHPRQAADTARHVPAVLTEMELLGLTGAGAPSLPGRNVATRDWAAARTALAEVLPDPIEHFVLQGDLTAVAPGYLSPEVAAGLGALAVAEGRGAAGVFRFSAASLKRAAAEGWSAGHIMDFLHRHSSTAVPQSLGYLVHEAARPIVQAASPIRNPAAHTPAATSSNVTAPCAEAATAAAVAESALQAQLAVLRGNPGATRSGSSDSGFGVALILEQLRAAITAGRVIRLLAVNGSGEVERLLVRPTSFEEGLLRTRLPDTGAMRSFNVHRIVGVEEPARQDGAKS